MYNITLLCTRHQEWGKCNSIELYKIIESIRPDVIFEELSLYWHMNYYDYNAGNSLETNAIKEYQYQNNNTAKQVAVDTYAQSTYDGTFMDIVFETQMDESRKLRELVDNQRKMEWEYGFNCLNSSQNDDLIEELHSLKEKILGKIGDEKLQQDYRNWKDIQDKRENKMLQNIYTYSKENPYHQGLFWVGSAHRKPIM